MLNAGKCKHFNIKAACVLTAVLVFAAAHQASGEEYVRTGYDSLKVLFDEAYGSGDYDTALEIANEITVITWPQHVNTLYNIACIYALKGEKVKAYDWLEFAVNAGYWDAGSIMNDDDLALLKGEPRFREIVRSAWSKGYIMMLERDERDEFQKPDMVMEALELKPGERVADVGAGSGYFTIPVARAVGADGIVWAIDISQEMLDYIEKRLEIEGLDNVELVKVERDDPQLPPGGVDLILMVDVFHYIKERTEYAEKLREGLAPGGRIVVIDYIPKPWDERPWGPLPQQQVPKETLNEEMKQAGLRIIKEYHFLPEQYFLVYGAE